VLSGTHVAVGRQVSTWVHVVKTDESVVLGVAFSFNHSLLEFVGGSGPFEPILPLRLHLHCVPGHAP
jgi:hypothetical protein